MKIRVGSGYDVHRLVEGRELWLGGVRVPHSSGLLGHSDADVVLHALCDALLGAARLRDIGYHFPDTAAAYAGIDSKILLKRSGELLREQGYRIGNVDVTILAQEPRLSPHIPRMEETIAAVLEIPADDVAVKATTTERLGFVGREEGIAASATVLIFCD